MTEISQLTNKQLNQEIGEALGYKFNVVGVRADLVVSPDGDKVELPNWSGNVGDAFELAENVGEQIGCFLAFCRAHCICCYMQDVGEPIGFYITHKINFRKDITNARWLSELAFSILQKIKSQ